MPFQFERHYEVQHEWVGTQRWHRTNTGVRPGVTTVLSGTEDQAWLSAWYERVGAEEAQRITQTATDRGSLLHAMIEAELTGRPLVEPKYDIGQPDPETMASLWRKFKPVLGAIDATVAIELDVEWFTPGADPLSTGNGYGGSIDCIAKVHGQPMLLDWKSANKTKRLDRIDNYRQQVAAYRAALEFKYPDLWNEYGGFEHAAIVVIPVSGPLQIVELEPDELNAELFTFHTRLEEFYAKSRLLQQEAA